VIFPPFLDIFKLVTVRVLSDSTLGQARNSVNFKPRQKLEFIALSKSLTTKPWHCVSFFKEVIENVISILKSETNRLLYPGNYGSRL
jgi:hypothetical protein